MMRIHREGYSTLAVSGLLLALLSILARLFLPSRWVSFVDGVGLIIFGLFAQFFRNPQRVTPLALNSVIAPADGKIVAIEPVPENEFFGDQRLKISIYMSALNVHVNRVPVSGSVVYERYHPGQYLVAFHPKASELNERNTVVFERPDGQQVLTRQIAGLLARRIRFYLRVGQAVQAGEELGFIKFGSRCDMFLPLDAKVLVQLEQNVTGGETVLAQI